MTGMIFAAIQVQEKCHEQQCVVFIDLTKTLYFISTQAKFLGI